MSRGGSFGGGQSSLGYLFGSSSDQNPNNPPRSPPPALPSTPPYGMDTDAEKKPTNPPPDHEQKEGITFNNNYQRAQGQNLGNFITNRPSTKVKSAPGGSSSLGFLFGEK
ncbi:Protein SPIRAL1-like 5 [Ancistrocladus abbreviatus]